jgi:hypothetical protein
VVPAGPVEPSVVAPAGAANVKTATMAAAPKVIRKNIAPYCR